MSTKKPAMTAAERKFQLVSVIENSCNKMKDASGFVMAVGKLLEAYANEEVSEDVMSSMVIGGLGTGLMMLSVDLWAGVDAAEQRTAEAEPGDIQ